jgi:hypothetical protein
LRVVGRRVDLAEGQLGKLRFNLFDLLASDLRRLDFVGVDVAVDLNVQPRQTVVVRNRRRLDVTVGSLGDVADLERAHGHSRDR